MRDASLLGGHAASKHAAVFASGMDCAGAFVWDPARRLSLAVERLLALLSIRER